MLERRTLAALTVALSAAALATPAHAIINQVDGTIVPVTGRLQSCLDKSPTASGTNPAPGDGPAVLNAVTNANIRPQTFLPNSGGASPYQVTFVDIGEGGGYQNRFGWYHVGDSPFDPANRHEIFDCRQSAAACDCPCNAGARTANGPTNACTTWVNTDTVRIDFACLRALPSTDANRWRGTAVAFYLMTPEALPGTTAGGNCPAVGSTTSRVYSTDNTVNDDGDYVHFLIYESRSFAQSYYFGWEDLFRGGDNDFEDMLVRANGLVPSCVPQAEICNGRDDNCDGNIDEGLGTTTCGVGTCQRTVNNCVGGATQTCVAGAPGTEACDGMDNNCNGQVDEGVTRPCTGACGTGTQYCIGGVFDPTCVTSRSPTAETCNGVDDDCNGMIDDGTSRACSTACGSGMQLCVAGSYGMCSAPSPAAEVCDGMDNNCNGVVDDGVAPRPCMSTCGAGMESCTGGRWVCNAPLPRPEVCNGMDDDCDGMVDDGVPDGGTCGRAVGVCMAGHFVCMGGMYVCQGTTAGGPETCNNLDDNCDGQVDEGLPPGPECNTAPDGAHLCTPGHLMCRAGAMVCEGGTRGGPEVCDCMDNDCNGMVDDVPAGGSLCPGGGRCLACQCRTPCSPDIEFPCSSGLICMDGVCVPPLCNGRTCPPGQTCRNNECVDLCAALTCPMGQICEVRNNAARCVENNCYVQGCTDPTQICINGACAPDLCRGMTCMAGQYCRDGACITACSSVTCPDGQSCTDGVCAADPCARQTCNAGTVCRVESGAARCVADNCTNLNCGAGRRCDNGMCVDDPCARITCPGDPADVVCRAGQCVLRNPPPRVLRDRGIASGGGGAACSVRVDWLGRGGARADGSSVAGWLGLGLAGLAAARVRRRRRRPDGDPRATGALRRDGGAR